MIQPTIRILVVTREHGLDRLYGLGRSIGRICEELKTAGYAVDYLSLDETRGFHRRWQRFIQPFLFYFGGARGLVGQTLTQGAAACRVALQAKPDLIWLQDPLMVAGFRLCLLAHGRLRSPSPIILTQHGLGSYTWAVFQDGIELSNRHYRRLLDWEGRQLSWAKQIVFPSKAARDAATRDFNLTQPPPAWTVIEHGVDIPKVMDRDGARQALNIDSNQIMVLAMGRLAPVKNYRVLVDAVATLQREGLNLQLVIAGAGDIPHFYQQMDLARLSPQPILGHRSDTADLLAACDVYVSCCEKESFGLANIEALAAGVPSIFASSGASQEIGGTGAWLIPMQHSHLTQALRILCTEPTIRDFWHSLALKNATEKASWHSVSLEYDTLFKSILSRPDDQP